MTEQPRQPAGSPDGGQFAGTQGAESTVNLADKPTVWIDIEHFDADGALAHVDVVDIRPYLQTLHPRARVALLDTGDDDPGVREYLHSTGHLKRGARARVNAGLALTDYATIAPGRRFLSGWDNSVDMAGAHIELWPLATRARTMTPDQRAELQRLSERRDTDTTASAYESAVAAIVACSEFTDDDVEDVYYDATRMASNPDTVPGAYAPTGPDGAQNEFGLAAVGVMARKYMRDREITPTAEYARRTTTAFTLEHYDTLTSGVRDVFGGSVDIDNSLRERQRYTDRN